MKEIDENSLNMGMRIQHARKAANLTQMQLSEKIDVSPQYISDLECGRVGCSVATLMKLCDTLGVSSDFILRGQESYMENGLDLSGKLARFTPEEREMIEEGVDLLSRALAYRR